MIIHRFMVTLTMHEIKAIHTALGRMSDKDYRNTAEASAASHMYNDLTPLVEEGE